jgi:membrane protease YdiL (CAAX protease family)
MPILGFALAGDLVIKFVLATTLSVPGLIYVIKHRELFELSYIGNWKKSLLFEASWLAPVLVVIALFGNQIRQILLTSVNYQGTLRTTVPPLLFILMYGLISSPLQELIFRGIMMHHSDKIFKKQFISVFVTSAAFSLSHLWYPSVSLVYITFILGIIWGISRIKYNSLIGPSVGHAIIGITGFMLNII